MNATCAIHGHDWFWRFALRMRMCARCWRLDVSPLTPRAGSVAVVPAAVPPIQRERPEVALRRSVA